MIRLIIKWLNAGEGTWVDPGKGTPQGAIVSPVLANVYLHYVFDLWTRKFWHKRKAGGDLVVIRYADDFVVGFQHRRDAEQYLADLKARLAKFGLEVHPTQTRRVEIGRFAASNRKKRGLGKPETFDFLGMTHYCAKTRNGYFRVGRKPARKRVAKTLRRIKDPLRNPRASTRTPDGWGGSSTDGSTIMPYREAADICRRSCMRSSVCSCAPCDAGSKRIAPHGPMCSDWSTCTGLKSGSATRGQISG